MDDEPEPTEPDYTLRPGLKLDDIGESHTHALSYLYTRDITWLTKCGAHLWGPSGFIRTDTESCLLFGSHYCQIVEIILITGIEVKRQLLSFSSTNTIHLLKVWLQLMIIFIID